MTNQQLWEMLSVRYVLRHNAIIVKKYFRIIKICAKMCTEVRINYEKGSKIGRKFTRKC